MMKLIAVLVACAALGLGLLLFTVALPLGLVLGGLALFLFWFWMLVDAIRNDRLSGWGRVGWATVIWFTHFIGAILYLLLGRRGGPARG